MTDSPEFPTLDPETEDALLADPEVRAALDAALDPTTPRVSRGSFAEDTPEV